MPGQRSSIPKWFLRIVIALQVIVAIQEIPAKSEGNGLLGTTPFNINDKSKQEGTNPARETAITSSPKITQTALLPKSTRANINATKQCQEASEKRKCHSKLETEKHAKPTASDKLTFDDILLVCGFAFTFIVGVFGNTFVCYVFGYKRRKHRSVTETLLLYLGAVDLLASFVNPLLFIYWTVTRYSRWDFGVVGCKILVPLAPITITLSATIIVIICLDRYRAIVSPFKGRYSKTHINIFVGIAVAISILSYTSYVIHLEVMPGSTCFVPDITAAGHAWPFAIITLIRDVGYTVMFCFTSAVIFHRLKVNERLQTNTQYLQKRRKDSKRICRVLFCVGVVFALLVFPKDALSLASTISWMSPPGISHTKAILYLNAWLKVLNTSNSCVNVFIYSHMHARFKTELCRLFGLCFKRSSTLNGGSTTVVTDDDYDSSSRNGDGKDTKFWLKNLGEDNNKNAKMEVNQGTSQMQHLIGNGTKETVVKFQNGTTNGFSEAEALIESEHI